MKGQHMNILSEYFGNNSEKQSLVYKENSEFCVRLLDRNAIIVKCFGTEEEAELYAEDWVYGEK
jgi:hypothetical protein